MKKRIGVLCIVIVIISLSVVVVSRYFVINRQYPRSKEYVVGQGEFIEYKDDIWLKVDQAKILSESERDYIYEQVNDTPFSDSKIWVVTITIENKSNKENRCELSDLNMETEGGSSGIVAAYLPFVETAVQSGVTETIKAGESKKLSYAYELHSAYFTKKQWENISEREMWLTFSTYPIKTKIMLKR